MRYVVNPTMPRAFIHPEVYGNFSEHLGRCIYEGVYVGENSTIPNVNGMRTDVVEALKKMKLPVLRWPGGCFADEYHWRDGIGPKESRKKMINTHWGGVVEDNSFGTHEFFELCRQIGCKPYVNGNVGSGEQRPEFREEIGAVVTQLPRMHHDVPDKDHSDRIDRGFGNRYRRNGHPVFLRKARSRECQKGRSEDCGLKTCPERSTARSQRRCIYRISPGIRDRCGSGSRRS